MITGGHCLPARHVIHAVGPVWDGGDHDEDRLLASCYRKALALAEAHGVRSIAFPAISCGAYGFPIDRAARVAVAALAESLPTCPTLEQVLLVAWDQRVERALKLALETTSRQ